MGEREREFLERAPKWRAKDVEAINGLFSSYIFRRSSTGEVWSTCCRKWARLPSSHHIWLCEHQAEPKGAWWGCHAGIITRPTIDQKERCPFCGRLGMVKDIKYTGKRKNLWEERRFVTLRYYNGALWALAMWAFKDYTDLSDLTAPPMIESGAAYRFGKAAVEYVPAHWYYGYGSYTKEPYESLGKKTVSEPFQYCSKFGSGYELLGLSELRKTPIKYCGAKEFMQSYDQFIKFIHLAYVYPRQVEILMKAGMKETVYDKAVRGVAHARVIDWEQTDPRKAFKVPRQILKEFLELKQCKIKLLETYKSGNKRDARFTLKDAADVYDIEIYTKKTVAKIAQEWGLTELQLVRYLRRSVTAEKSPHAAYMTWRDYADAAQKIGYPMHREKVLLPIKLGEAHDKAVKAYRKQLDKARKEQEETERTARAEGYKRIKSDLKLRYEVETEGLMIRVPESEDEIIAEGKALQHCVGGYARRHAEGVTTILFLRKSSKPDKPFITIEMRGGQLIQIHGYKNEWLKGGRTAPDPRQVYSWFVDPWLAWIQRGSKRKKDGSPKGLHIEKEAKSA